MQRLGFEGVWGLMFRFKMGFEVGGCVCKAHSFERGQEALVTLVTSLGLLAVASA